MFLFFAQIVLLEQKYIDGKIVLVSATDDALPFTIDNKQVEFNSFADSVVYENKLARVKGSMPPPPQGNTPQPNMPANKILSPAAVVECFILQNISLVGCEMTPPE